jgi:hypothetical protein
MIKKELVEDFFSREIKFKGVKRELEISKINKIISIVGPRRAVEKPGISILYLKN